MLVRLLSVCAGGAIGSGARFLLATWATRAGPHGFPTGTLVVNLAGSFVVGVVMHLSLKSTVVSADLRLFLVAGVAGGFTTYSSFSYETIALYQQGSHGLALANIGGTLFGCFTATVLGMLAAQLVVR